MSAAWSWFIVIFVVLNVAGAMWLLFATAKRGPGETTGHTWDEDLTEYNKPLPLWWMGLFLITTVFGACYLAFYPGLGANPGLSSWTSAKEHDAAVPPTKRSP